MDLAMQCSVHVPIVKKCWGGYTERPKSHQTTLVVARDQFLTKRVHLSFVRIFPYGIQVDVPIKVVASRVRVSTAERTAGARDFRARCSTVQGKERRSDHFIVANHIGISNKVVIIQHHNVWNNNNVSNERQIDQEIQQSYTYRYPPAPKMTEEGYQRAGCDSTECDPDLAPYQAH